ncbi:MAG: hypothetical protein H6977_01445 [Gammaproteobacteria bacterium]|nr:hypothetical protein [Gammaproteobacteria bacterium]
MAHDNPPLEEILRTVREFLVDLTPRLDGKDRYHGLVSAFLVEIVERELAGEWQHPATADDRRLRELALALGVEPGDEHLHAVLSRALRAGRADARMDEVLGVLIDHVVDKVRVTRPDLLALEHRADD